LRRANAYAPGIANVTAIAEELARLKPAGAELPYFQSIAVSGTMSPSIKIDTSWAREFVLT